MMGFTRFDELARYWREENVPCSIATLGGALAGTELAVIWRKVGMPTDELWLFRFEIPSDPMSKDEAVKIATIGAWTLHVDLATGECFTLDQNEARQFANTSVIEFAELLTVFHAVGKQLRRECGGDSRADWDRGDEIVAVAERAMRELDPPAFQQETFLWPTLLVDIRG